MSGIRIRASEERDVEAVARIYGEAVATGTASFELEPPDLVEMQRRRAAILADGYPYLVADRNGEILGYSYGGAYRPRPAYRNAVEDSVYVAADRHGQGIGRLLLAALIEETSRRGFRQMVAVIGDSANLPSIRLHEQLGFAHVGVLRGIGWKHGRWLDSVMMQRGLGPGDGEPPRLRSASA
jgi:phosphinothricin acetyltransferase